MKAVCIVRLFVCPGREEVCRRTDRAGTRLRADRGAGGTTDGRARPWAAITCAVISRPGHPNRRRRVRRANRRRPAGLWHRRLRPTGRRSSGGSQPPKRY